MTFPRHLHQLQAHGVCWLISTLEREREREREREKREERREKREERREKREREWVRLKHDTWRDLSGTDCFLHWQFKRVATYSVIYKRFITLPSAVDNLPQIVILFWGHRWYNKFTRYVKRLWNSAHSINIKSFCLDYRHHITVHRRCTLIKQRLFLFKRIGQDC